MRLGFHLILYSVIVTGSIGVVTYFVTDPRLAVAFTAVAGLPGTALVAKFNKAHQDHAVDLAVWAKNTRLHFDQNWINDGVVRSILPDEQAENEDHSREGATRFGFLRAHAAKNKTWRSALDNLADAGQKYDAAYVKAHDLSVTRLAAGLKDVFGDQPGPNSYVERNFVDVTAIFEYLWGRMNHDTFDGAPLVEPIDEYAYQGAGRKYRWSPRGRHEVVFAAFDEPGMVKESLESTLEAVAKEDAVWDAVDDMKTARVILIRALDGARPSLDEMARTYRVNRDMVGKCGGCPHIFL